MLVVLSRGRRESEGMEGHGVGEKEGTHILQRLLGEGAEKSVARTRIKKPLTYCFCKAIYYLHKPLKEK